MYKEKFINKLIWLSQFFLLPIIFYPLTVIFFRRHIQGKEHMASIGKPFILISNHISFFDHFFFRFIGNWSARQLPLRFMAVKKFTNSTVSFLSKIGIVPVIYFLFGAFVIRLGEGKERNLARAKEILKAGGNVVIYPEGHIVTDGTIHPFKDGAASLAVETGTPILPISLRFGIPRLFRRDIAITIGQPIMPNTESTETFNQTLHRKIEDLNRS